MFTQVNNNSLGFLKVFLLWACVVTETSNVYYTAYSCIQSTVLCIRGVKTVTSIVWYDSIQGSQYDVPAK